MLTHRELGSVKGETLVPVRHRPRELLGDLFTGLAVDSLLLPPFGGVDRVTSLPAPVGAEADRALAIATPTHHRPPSSTCGALRPKLRPIDVPCAAALRSGRPLCARWRCSSPPKGRKVP